MCIPVDARLNQFSDLQNLTHYASDLLPLQLCLLSHQLLSKNLKEKKTVIIQQPHLGTH
jgi:hypothetical protein